MNNEKTSQAKPVFKQITPEEMEAYLQKMDEVCKEASENLEKGIYPNRKLEP